MHIKSLISLSALFSLCAISAVEKAETSAEKICPLLFTATDECLKINLQKEYSVYKNYKMKRKIGDYFVYHFFIPCKYFKPENWQDLIVLFKQIANYLSAGHQVELDIEGAYSLLKQLEENPIITEEDGFQERHFSKEFKLLCETIQKLLETTTSTDTEKNGSVYVAIVPACKETYNPPISKDGKSVTEVKKDVVVKQHLSYITYLGEHFYLWTGKNKDPNETIANGISLGAIKIPVHLSQNKVIANFIDDDKKRERHYNAVSILKKYKKCRDSLELWKISPSLSELYNPSLSEFYKLYKDKSKTDESVASELYKDNLIYHQEDCRIFLAKYEHKLEEYKAQILPDNELERIKSSEANIQEMIRLTVEPIEKNIVVPSTDLLLSHEEQWPNQRPKRIYIVNYPHVYS
jgi:hypothetical protein